MRMWVIWLMSALWVVAGAASLAMLMAMAREQRAKRTGFLDSRAWMVLVIHGLVVLVAVWFNLYVFVEPFRRWQDGITGWTSW